jgi:predicted phage terminase large subunit-like protein
LRNLIRERFNYPDLKKAALELGHLYPDAITLIEEKGSGISLIQDLRDMQIAVVGIKPETDKVTRLHACAPQFESGSVFFPCPVDNVPWLDDLVAELLAFPGGKHDDQVDSFTGNDVDAEQAPPPFWPLRDATAHWCARESPGCVPGMRWRGRAEDWRRPH